MAEFDQAVERLAGALLAATEKSLCLKTERAGAIAFSGGLDSLLLALLTRRAIDSSPIKSQKVPILLFAVGFENSYDLTNAERAARFLAGAPQFTKSNNHSTLTLKKIVISEGEVEKALTRVSRLISSDNPVKVSTALPFYFIAERAAREAEGKKEGTRITTLLCGQGADELFGGYARYVAMSAEEAQKALSADAQELKTTGVAQYDALSVPFGLRMRYPFLDADVVRIATALPLEYKIRDGERKIILRAIAASLGASSEFSNQKKKAMQYGSGVMRAMKNIAKKHNMSLSQYLNKNNNE